MFVLFVRVTNQCKRPILCVLSATCSLLLPMYASEREGKKERTREANKYFSLSFAHIYASLPYAYAFSSWRILRTDKYRIFSIVQCFFFPALSISLSLFISHLTKLSYIYIPNIFHSFFISDQICLCLLAKFFSYKVK
jgi:hypothetical protein